MKREREKSSEAKVLRNIQKRRTNHKLQEQQTERKRKRKREREKKNDTLTSKLQIS